MSDVTSKNDTIKGLPKRHHDVPSEKLERTISALMKESEATLVCGDGIKSGSSDSIGTRGNSNHCLTTGGNKYYIYFRPSKALLDGLNMRVSNQNEKI